MTHSVVFNNVTKKYKMYHKSSERIKDMLLPKGSGEDFYALQNISFTANPGDVIGVVGVNGAGKSTLSNLIAGIVPSTSGEIEINGQASLISISSGLDSQLTGRDNIEYKCLMLGFKKSEIRELMPSIIEFADIGHFIDQPVKNYSSGMKSRLGFAISVNIDPDILVIDEALSVGDKTFTDKCLDKMEEFKEKGKTIFFISHSVRQVKKFCDKALWLEAGEVKAYGTLKQVIPQYRTFLKEFKALSDEEKKNFRQKVLEHRSKLRAQESEENDTDDVNNQAHEDETVEQERVIPRGQTRTYRSKRRLYIRVLKWALLVIVFIAVISGGVAYIGKAGLLSDKSIDDEEPEPVPTTEKAEEEAKEEQEDIRYVQVDSAYVRNAPNLDSEASSVASFGQSYTVEDTKQASSDKEWLKVTSNITNQEGWVSSSVMKKVAEEDKSDEIADKIDALIGFHPALEETIPMIGKNKEEAESFDYTEYKYLDEQVTGFTITVSDSSDTEVIDELGDPQIEIKNRLLYHGSDYDFIFTLLNDGMVDKLSVVKHKEK